MIHLAVQQKLKQHCKLTILPTNFKKVAGQEKTNANKIRNTEWKKEL